MTNPLHIHGFLRCIHVLQVATKMNANPLNTVFLQNELGFWTLRKVRESLVLDYTSVAIMQQHAANGGVLIAMPTAEILNLLQIRGIFERQNAANTLNNAKLLWNARLESLEVPRVEPQPLSMSSQQQPVVLVPQQAYMQPVMMQQPLTDPKQPVMMQQQVPMYNPQQQQPMMMNSNQQQYPMMMQQQVPMYNPQQQPLAYNNQQPVMMQQHVQMYNPQQPTQVPMYNPQQQQQPMMMMQNQQQQYPMMMQQQVPYNQATAPHQSSFVPPPSQNPEI